ncbi:MAG TPA: hypothetical protein VGY66_36800 [Gemmataceae bacterium]|jgi:hypothetical protein|nr:hypothetical protein [Gemmataceae bacterium]
MNNATPDPQAEIAGLRAECDRLQERVRELELRHEQDQKTLAELEECRKALYGLAKRMFSDRDLHLTPEEVQDLLAGKDCLPLDAFIEELEKTALGR